MRRAGFEPASSVTACRFRGPGRYQRADRGSVLDRSVAPGAPRDDAGVLDDAPLAAPGHRPRAWPESITGLANVDVRGRIEDGRRHEAVELGLHRLHRALSVSRSSRKSIRAFSAAWPTAHFCTDSSAASTACTARRPATTSSSPTGPPTRRSTSRRTSAIVTAARRARSVELRSSLGIGAGIRFHRFSEWRARRDSNPHVNFRSWFRRPVTIQLAHERMIGTPGGTRTPDLHVRSVSL